jgi:hypothetical protein
MLQSGECKPTSRKEREDAKTNQDLCLWVVKGLLAPHRGDLGEHDTDAGRGYISTGY